MKHKAIGELKVVELANVLAGPMVGTFFSELGAEVIKVEYPGTGGDVTRSWKLPSEEDDHPFSAYYCCANSGKKRLMLDLEQASDYQVLVDQLRETDVFITNYPPSNLTKLSVDYEHLKNIYPELIYGHILSFRSDPERPAYDVLLQAETGYLSMCGQENGELAKMPVALIDLLTAHQLKEALLLALLDSGERGQYVSVALDEVAVASLANQATNWLMEQHLPKPMGTRHPNIAPYGDLYRSKDEVLFTLAIGSDRQFRKMTEQLKWEGGRNPDFATNKRRLQYRQKLNSHLNEIFSGWIFDELYNTLLDKEIPIGEIRDVSRVLDQPEYKQLIQTENLSDNFTCKRILSTIVHRR